MKQHSLCKRLGNTTALLLIFVGLWHQAPFIRAAPVDYEVNWPAIHLQGAFTLDVGSQFGTNVSTSALGTYGGLNGTYRQRWTKVTFKSQPNFAEIFFIWDQGYTGYAMNPWYAGRTNLWTSAAEAWEDLVRRGAAEKVYITAVPVPPIISCPAPLITECTDGGISSLTVHVEDSRGKPLEVVWFADGVAWQTNYVEPGSPVTSADVTFSANFGMGEHSVTVTASNGETDVVACTTSVVVNDTTAPHIAALRSTPSALWSPDNKMRNVTVEAVGADNCSSVVWRIASVSSNESNSSEDWKITGDLTVQLRAKRSGNNSHRVYSILVECSDEAGNVNSKIVTVTVPHDQKGRISTSD